MTLQALSLPVPPGSSDEAPALTATHGNCATSGPGGPSSDDDFTAGCRALSYLFGRNHARRVS